MAKKKNNKSKNKNKNNKNLKNKIPKQNNSIILIENKSSEIPQTYVPMFEENEEVGYELFFNCEVVPCTILACYNSNGFFNYDIENSVGHIKHFVPEESLRKMKDW
jgi:hypothetical protein